MKYICLECGDRTITENRHLCPNGCNKKGRGIDYSSIDFGDNFIKYLKENKLTIENILNEYKNGSSFAKLINKITTKFLEPFLKENEHYSAVINKNVSHKSISIHYLHEFLFLNNFSNHSNNKDSDSDSQILIETSRFSLISKKDNDFVPGESGDVHCIREKNGFGKTTFLNELLYENSEFGIAKNSF